VLAVAALVANEQYGNKHDCFSGGVEMSTTAVVEHVYFLQRVGPITRVLDTSFDRIVLTIHCRAIDTRRDIDSSWTSAAAFFVAPEDLCARAAAPAAAPMLGNNIGSCVATVLGMI
jgi:hypothetical protein